MNEHTETSFDAAKARRWVQYADRLASQGDRHGSRMALLTALDTITRRLAILTRELASSEVADQIRADAEAAHALAYAARRALRYQPRS